MSALGEQAVVFLYHLINSREHWVHFRLVEWRGKLTLLYCLHEEIRVRSFWTSLKIMILMHLNMFSWFRNNGIVNGTWYFD